MQAKPGRLLGIVAALPSEAKCLVNGPNQYRNISRTSPLLTSEHTEKPLLFISGVGPRAARAAATMLVEHGATGLLSWGCAGALSRVVHPGELLLPRTIFTEDGQTIDTDKIWHKRWTEHLSGTLTWHENTLVESSKIILDVGEKKQLAHCSGAIAVDMESAAIGRIARQAGIPFMVIRTLADTADEGLPPCIVETMFDEKDIQIWRILPALLGQPWLWPAMIRLGLHFRAATHTLRIVSKQSGPQCHIT